MPSPVAEAGENQGLPFDGRRVHQKSGTVEATRRKTRSKHGISLAIRIQVRQRIFAEE